MIGLDTNTLLRLLLRDDEGQFDRLVTVLQALPRDEAVMINALVIQEAVWVMMRVLSFPKAKVIGILQDLLAQDDLLVVPTGAVARAVSAWARGRADFADYLIAEFNAEGGCRMTLTFDQRAANYPAFRRVR